MIRQLTREVTVALALDLSSSVKSYGHFINGEWVESNSGETIELWNPATGALLAQTQSGDALDVDRAVNAAHDAFPAWSASSPMHRQFLLREIASRILARHLDYAMMETLNNGKTITESFIHDIAGAIGVFEYYAGAAFHLHGQVSDFAGTTQITHREPIGVIAQIIPWNVPLMMTALKLAPALAAGCTVVLKPAETAWPAACGPVIWPAHTAFHKQCKPEPSGSTATTTSSRAKASAATSRADTAAKAPWPPSITTP